MIAIRSSSLPGFDSDRRRDHPTRMMARAAVYAYEMEDR